MTTTGDNDFTNNLKSLLLQAQTLLDGVGGDEAGALLDALGSLHETERKAVLPVMIQALKNLAASESRPIDRSELELKAFEESLYQSVAHALQEAANSDHTNVRKAFAVIDGGKWPARDGKAIDLSLERQRRQARGKL